MGCTIWLLIEEGCSKSINVDQNYGYGGGIRNLVV